MFLIAIVGGISFAVLGVSMDTIRYAVLAAGGVAGLVLLVRYLRGGAQSVEPEVAPAPVGETGWTDTEVLQRVLAQTRKAVGFRPVFPPKHPMEGMTFFGGRPIGPRGLHWPSYEGEGARKAALFMGQVAIGDLPAVEELEGLDEDLVLYFFLPLYYGGGDPIGMVVTASGDPDGWTEVAPPEAASEIGSLSFMDSWSTLSGRAMMTFPKWEMEPAVVDSFPADIAVPGIHRDRERYYRLKTEVRSMQELAWGDVFGEQVRPPSALPRDCPPETLVERLPQVWLSVEAVAAEVLSALDGHANSLRHCATSSAERLAKAEMEYAEGQDPSGEKVEKARAWAKKCELELAELGPAIGPLKGKAAPWFDRARAQSALAAVPEAEWTGFLDLLRELQITHPKQNGRAGSSRTHIVYIVDIVAPQVTDVVAAYGPETYERLTELQLDAVRHRHGGLRRSLDEVGRYDLKQHQMFGTPVDIQGTGGADDILLMQFVYDEGMDWQIGDAGAAQYWISRADLAAGRFDRVTLTVEGH